MPKPFTKLYNPGYRVLLPAGILFFDRQSGLTATAKTARLATGFSYRAPMPVPSRIVCLSAEAVDVLYLLGCGRRIVGVTSFAAEPPAARRKPRVSGFSSVNFEKIDALKPDLVITFSDVQADAARELVRRGHTVLATNQRSLPEIFKTIRLVGRVVGRAPEAGRLVDDLRRKIGGPKKFPRGTTSPKVYFEEWDAPHISGIRWVGELIEAAGGRDIFPELRECSRAPDRVVTGDEVVRRRPDIIIASWCGKQAKLAEICRRPGWETIPAVRHGQVYEIKSAHILQPGPGLLKGLQQLRKIIKAWHHSHSR